MDYNYWDDKLGDGDDEQAVVDDIKDEIDEMFWGYDGPTDGRPGDRRLAVSCDITLNLYDSFGDGWNNGGWTWFDYTGKAIDSGTVAGSSSQKSLCVEDTVGICNYTFTADDKGSYLGERSWSITDASGGTLAFGCADTTVGMCDGYGESNCGSDDAYYYAYYYDDWDLNGDGETMTIALSVVGGIVGSILVGLLVFCTCYRDRMAKCCCPKGSGTDQPTPSGPTYNTAATMEPGVEMSRGTVTGQDVTVVQQPLPAAVAIAVAAPQLNSPSSPRRASIEYREDSGLVKVREEAWYYQYVNSVTDSINNWAEKNKFKEGLEQNNADIRVFGIEGDVNYGRRTRYEWTCLQEDCDRAFKDGTLAYRASFVRVRFDKDAMEEEIGDWLTKQNKVRFGVMASCPSRIGQNGNVMRAVRAFCGNYDNISVNFSSENNVVNGLTLESPRSSFDGGALSTQVAASTPAENSI